MMLGSITRKLPRATQALARQNVNRIQSRSIMLLKETKVRIDRDLFATLECLWCTCINQYCVNGLRSTPRLQWLRVPAARGM